MVVKNDISKRLKKYGTAAVALAAVGLASNAVEAEQVSVTGISLEAFGSPAAGTVEGFLAINGFAAGASTFGYAFSQNAFSGANPLGGTATDVVLRAGWFANGTNANGFGQLNARNGGGIAISNVILNTSLGNGLGTFAIDLVANVGSAFNTGGTAFNGNPGSTNGNLNFNGLPYYAGGGGPWGNGLPNAGTAYFQFVNATDGQTYDGWLDIEFSVVGDVLTQTVTGIHVDTGIPEPSSMALLCMGAAGLAAYRRRRSA